MEKGIQKEQIIDDLKKLGLKKGDLVNVKVSLSSIGKVEGGASSVVDAILEVIGDEGTLVSEAFIAEFLFPMSPKEKKVISSNNIPTYAGAIASTMTKYPASFRSLHPVQKFVAIGSRARELMFNHTPQTYAFDPLRVMAENKGINLRIGGTDKVVGVGTTHVAIGLTGLRQKRFKRGIYYLDDSGEKKLFISNWAGGCASGFNRLFPFYRDNGAILSEGKVGEAESMITDMKKTLDVEVKELKKNPGFFMCDYPGCVHCRLTWEFSDKSYLRTFVTNLFRGDFRKAAMSFVIPILGSYLPPK